MKPPTTVNCEMNEKQETKRRGEGERERKNYTIDITIDARNKLSEKRQSTLN